VTGPARDEVRVVTDPRALATAAAKLIEDRITAVLARRDSAVLALSGGGTPVPTFRRLATRRVPRCDWRRVEWFWVDERCLPARHRDSNYGTARRVLLRPLGVPAARVHPIQAGVRSPASAARAYERLLRRVARDRRGTALFDLVLLGLGRDGHTASLFPGSPSEAGRWVEAIEAPSGVLPPRRITMTPGALNQAENVVFLVSGAGKSEPVRDALLHRADPLRVPARRIVPAGRRIWLVDRAAAALL